MYKLLIVDDEDFEREGMAQMIDWKQYASPPGHDTYRH